MNYSWLKEFVAPGSQYRGKAFWAWNGKLDPEELRKQVRVFHKMGLGGFFMHSRVGLATKYLSDDWFECIDACIDEAGKLGMEAWLYDEDRWPSGAAGGLVTKNPKYRMRSLVLEQTNNPRNFKWSSSVLAVFTAKVEGHNAYNVKRVSRGRRPNLAKCESILAFRIEMDPLSDYFNGYTYLDTLNNEAVGEFIRTTHEAYRERVGEHFGKVVPGIFTDEPYHGLVFWSYRHSGKSLPWTAKLPSVFKCRYDYDILDHLPKLFFDLDADPISPARYNYHDCVTYLFVNAFARQIGKWCEENNMRHTGHVEAEELLSSYASKVGSCMRFYEYMQVPGMDVLTQYKREYDTAKQVSSAARQFSRKWRLTETYGCTGWDFPFAGHKALGDWQVAMGINLRCQHLSLYTMQGEAKRDYPASISYQSPWWEIYSKVEDYFARIHTVMTRGEEVRDLLVIHPVESTWMFLNIDWQNNPAVSKYDKMLIDLRDTLLAANIDFDYGDEDILARHGKVVRKQSKPTFVVGRAQYRAVVIPPLLTMRASTLKLLERFKSTGGTVIFAGKPADFVDAVASKSVAKFANRCIKTLPKGQALVAAVEPVCRRVSITDALGKEIISALYLLREDKNAFYLFLCNVGHDFRKHRRDYNEYGEDRAFLSHLRDEGIRNRTADFDDVRISGFVDCDGKPMELDANTGKVCLAEAKRRGNDWEIRTSLPKLGSRLFVIPKKTSKKPLQEQKKLKDVKVQKLKYHKWDITLSENNNLVLDRPCYRVRSGRWRQADEILRVDRSVRDELSIPHRSGQMLQPWAQKKTNNPKSVPVELSYSFDVNVVPSGDLFLGIERPELYSMLVNGRQISTDVDSGWWVDKSLRKISIDPALLRIGENNIRITCKYDENHPGLEAVYLLGDFGTLVRGINVAITELPKALKLGDWTKQGLAFYSGSVGYRKTIPTKLGKGCRLFVQVPIYRGAAVGVLINGKSAGVIGWEPNEIDITDFIDGDKTELTIELIGHRRNSHGPLHLRKKCPVSIGPYSFMTSGEEWSNNYQLVQCGIMEPPQLVVRR